MAAFSENVKLEKHIQEPQIHFQLIGNNGHYESETKVWTQVINSLYAKVIFAAPIKNSIFEYFIIKFQRRLLKAKSYVK